MGRGIDLQVTPLYKKNWEAIHNPKYKVIFNQSGTRSGKTYSICQCIVVECQTKPNTHVSIVRISLPLLKRTVIKDIKEILTNMGIYDVRNHNKTEQIYQFSNGSTIEFVSADSTMKLKGSKRDILFLNEATELPHSAYIQLAMRTKGKIIVDFNPEDIDWWGYEVMKDPDSITIKSTYKDNPFLPDSQVKFIEDKIKVDKNWYKVYVLGERPMSNSRIYSHFKTYDDILSIGEEDNYAYGLDFGYNHPTALVKCVFVDDDTIGKGVYINEEIYKSKLTISDLITEMNEIGIDKRKPIYCDSARPEIIEELRRSGYTRAQLSNKNVKGGIDKVKSQPIHIHTLSFNLLKEYKRYSWKVENERILEEPVKIDDDGMDAMRYCIHTHIKAAFNPFYASVYTF